jgi:hypothetical protein
LTGSSTATGTTSTTPSICRPWMDLSTASPIVMFPTTEPLSRDQCIHLTEKVISILRQRYCVSFSGMAGRITDLSYKWVWACIWQRKPP